MKISGQLEWTDYLKAQYLHMQPNLVGQILRYVLVGFLAIALAGYAVLSIVYGDQAGFWPYSWPVFLIAALFLLYYYAVLPWGVRRMYEQQKKLSLPFEHEITPSSLISSNPYGHVTRLWRNFYAWKENRSLLMLYPSDAEFIVIPKRFCTEEQIEAVRAYVRQNKVARGRSLGRPQVILLSIYFILLLVVGIITYMGTRNRIP